MNGWMSLAFGLSAAVMAGSAQAQAVVVLTCPMAKLEAPAPGTAGPEVMEERVFRIGKGSFEEWRATDRRYGPNLCAVFSCSANADRTEGVIGSASVSYTIGIDHKTRAGYWRSVGASGRRETQGSCRETPDPAAGAKGQR